MKLKKIAAFFLSTTLICAQLAAADCNAAETPDQQPYALSDAAPAGDLNGDGALSAADAVVLARYIAEIEDTTVSDEALEQSDYDGDGLLTLRDVMYLLLKLYDPYAPPTYTLDQIAYDAEAFRKFAIDLMYETVGIYLYDFGYGYTTGARESLLFLALLNEDKIQDNVLRDVFSEYSADDLYNFRILMYNIGIMQNNTGNNIDFSKYTLNQELGNYMNFIESTVQDGTFEQLFEDVRFNDALEEKFFSTPVLSLN